MATRTIQSEPFDPAAPEASSSGSSASASMQGVLLRVLLAGAVALLVLLLPGELAASRDQVGAFAGRGLDRQSDAVEWPSRRGRADDLEIRRRDTC